MVFWTSLTVPCRHDGTPRCRVLRVITKPRGLLRKNARRSHRAFIQRLNLSPEELQEKIQKIKHSRDYSLLFQDVSRLPIIKSPPLSSLLRQSLLGSNPTSRGYSGSTQHGGSLIRGLCSTKSRVKKQGPIPKISRMPQHQDRTTKSPPKSSQLGFKKTTHPFLENKVNARPDHWGSLDNTVRKQGSLSVTPTTAKVAAGDRTKSVCLKRKQQGSTAAEKKINGGADSLHETQQKPAMTSSMEKEGCVESTRQGLAFAKKKINSDSGSNSSRKSVQKPATHIEDDKMVNGDCNKAGPSKIRFVCGGRDFSKEIGLPKALHCGSISRSISCS
ncbi:hypothetical protein SLEP1_g26622 [Rubroshorea leprosula]|uniref:Uncharacterized protein n=1 Tax=Rubroshorea leprosula TaxID=152421 RepID=A0AAV5JYV2_9ROSI|nr:hypothetical protein SLEP1_g26622 [Rubroshorea leprosula]